VAADTNSFKLAEPADGNALTVPDLPLMDFAAAVTGLALAIVLLIAWAY
jgi:hypothetical protein